MKGDFTRFSYNPSQHYSGVLMQQGRVSLDADWNEQVSIQTHRQELEAIDLVGQNGAPASGGGFAVTVSADGVTTSGTGTGQYLLISPGHMYVDGLLCDLAAQTRYDQQSQYPGATVPAPNGTDTSTGNAASGNYVYLAYLDAWERHVTAIEDPNLLEVALGGQDSGTRKQVVTQVKLAALSSETSPANPVAASDWSAITAPSGALLAAVPFAPDTPGALSLSGGAYVQLPTFPATTNWSNGFALEAWVYLQGVVAPTGVTIIQLGDPTATTILLATGSTSGSLQLTVGATSVVAQGVLQPNQWIQVAASVDASRNVTMYVNGTQVAAGTIPSFPTNAARTQCFLGHSASAPAYNGMICEVHVWSAPIQAPALSNRLAGTEANLVAYYKLNELAYGVVDDSSPSHLNGSVQGTSTPTWSTNAPALAAAGAAASGYYGAENQLYRVEIHAMTPITTSSSSSSSSGGGGGTLYQVTAKWSRDNGSVASAATLSASSGSIPPTQTLTLPAPARDDVLGWAVGQWVEINTINGDLLGPGTLTQISSVQGSTLTVGAVTSPPPGPVKVRRWDSTPTLSVTLPSAQPLPWMPLENGIYVQIGATGPVMPGDHWTMPARTATKSIVWPVGSNGQPLALSPAGIKHHYAQLAKVYLQPGTSTWVASPVAPVQQIFPPLTNILPNTGQITLGTSPNSVTVNGTLWVTGLTTAAGGLNVTGGPLNVGNSGTSQPANVWGLLTAENGLTVANGGITISTPWVAGNIGPVLTLLNQGTASSGNLGTATAINFETYAVGSNAPAARLESIDDGAASNHLVFYTKIPGSGTNALSERMRLTSGGMLGIATSAPTYTFEVAGQAYIHSTVIAGTTPGASYNILTANGASAFNGVVTAGPSGSSIVNLAVNGAETVTGELSAGTATAAGSSTVNLAVNGASNLFGLVTAGASGSAANNLTVNGLATITASVSGAIGPTLTLLNSSGGGASTATAINFDTSNTNLINPNARIESLDDGNFSNHLIFATRTPGNSGNGTFERMRVASNGYVGINNSSPAYYLDVAGSANVSSALTVGSFITVGAPGTSQTTTSLTCNGTASVTGYCMLQISTVGSVSSNVVPTSGVYFGAQANIYTWLNGSTYTLILYAPAIDLNGPVTAGPSGSSANNLTVNGAATVSASVSAGLGPALTLLNSSGGGAGTATAINFETYSPGANAPCARIESIDDGSFSNILTFSTKTPGSVSNGLVERFRVSSTGNFGIGTTAPAYLLDVNGVANVSGGLNTTGAVVGAPGSSGTNLAVNGAGTLTYALTAGSSFPPGSSNINLTVNGQSLLNGSVTAGASGSTANNLTVNGTATVTLNAPAALGPQLSLYNPGAGAAASTAINFDTYNIGANAHCARIQSYDDGQSSNHLLFATKTPGSASNPLVERMRLSSAGLLGIGMIPTHTLDVNGNASISNGLSVTGTLNIGSWDANNANEILFNNTVALKWSPSANQLLVTGAGTFYVNGAVAAISKPFIIPHPLDPERNLVHCCIEGPESGVYYRGEARLSDGVATVELPPYFEALTRPEGRTVQLTPIWDGDDAPCSPLCATPVREGRFRVRAIDRACSTQRFYWEVKAVRADIAPLEVEPPRRA
jgi:hypothetical protein